MATSYSNPYGSGDRRTHLLITSSGLFNSSNIIDGSTSDTNAFLDGGTTGSIEFSFPFKAVIDEAKWYQSTSASHGTWKWQGSNDRSSWTDIGSTFTLGGATTQTQTQLNGNSTAYAYYRLLQTAGNSSNAPWIHEVEFKIDTNSGPAYTNTLGSGDRTASITITEAGVTWNGTKSTLVNGALTDVLFWNGATNTGASVTFDLGASYVVTQARWYQDSVNSQGDWKWQGSNDGSSFTDIGSSFTLGGAVITQIPTLNANTTAYRYYRMTGVSGSHTGSPWLREINFMIAGSPSGGDSPSQSPSASTSPSSSVSPSASISPSPSASPSSSPSATPSSSPSASTSASSSLSASPSATPSPSPSPSSGGGGGGGGEISGGGTVGAVGQALAFNQYGNGPVIFRDLNGVLLNPQPSFNPSNNVLLNWGSGLQQAVDGTIFCSGLNSPSGVPAAGADIIACYSRGFAKRGSKADGKKYTGLGYGFGSFFYVLDITLASPIATTQEYIHKVNTAGQIVDTYDIGTSEHLHSFNIPANSYYASHQFICVSPAGVAYFAHGLGTLTLEGTTIRSYDLNSRAAGADLGSEAHGWFVANTGGMTTLQNGDIIVAWSGGSPFIKRYNAAGSVLSTYTLSDASGGTDICVRPDTDATHFWASYGGATEHVKKIRVSDGAVVASLTFALSTNRTPMALLNIASEPVVPNVANVTDPEGQQPVSSPTMGTCCEAPGAPAGSQSPTPGEVPPAVGWIPACTPGMGALPIEDAASNPSMVGVVDPRGFLGVDFKSFNPNNTVVTAEFEAFTTDQTINDAPDYEYGRKRGLINDVAEITRGISDDDGNFQGSTMNFTLSDKDRSVLRARLGDPARQYVLSREGRFSIYNEIIRDVQGTPQRLFRGLVTGHDLEAGFNAQLRFEDVITAQVGRFGPDKGYSTRRFPKVMWPFAVDLAQKPVQYIFGEVSDRGAVIQTADGGDGAKGMVPLWLMGARPYNGVMYDEYHLAGHAVKDFELYGTNNAAERPKRVWLDLDALGASGDVLAPGYTGWPLAEKYLDILNPADQGGDGLIHRVTHIFIKSDHYLTDAHKRGSVTLAANVCGVEDQGDGEGELITDMFTIFQFIWEQIVTPSKEWTSGLYGPAPRWNDNTLIVDSESFAAAQARTVKAIGGRGYQGAGVLCGPADGPVGVRELMRRMTQSSGARFTWSGAGQLKCIWTDPNDATAVNASRLYTEPSGIREWPSPTYPEDLICNHMLASYDYDDDAKRFRAEYDYRDEISIGRIGYRPTQSPREMRFCRDKTTAEHVVQRQVYFRKYPPVMVPVVLPLKKGATDHNPGDFIRISSREGPTLDDSTLLGFNKELMEVQTVTYNDKKKQVKMMCRALGAASVYAPLSPIASSLSPFAPILDDANRPNEDPLDFNGQWGLLGPWYGIDGLRLVTDQFATPTTGASQGFGGSVWLSPFVVPGGPFVQTNVLPAASGGNYIEFFLAEDDQTTGATVKDGYSVYIQWVTSEWRLFIDKIVSTVRTNLYSQPVDFAAGDEFQVIKTSGLVKVYMYDSDTDTTRLEAAVSDATYDGPFYVSLDVGDLDGTPNIARLSNFGISPNDVTADDEFLLLNDQDPGVMRLF